MISLFIVHLIATTISEGFVVGDKDAIFIAEGGNEIKIVDVNTNETMVEIETQGTNEIKIVVNGDEEKETQPDEMSTVSDDESSTTDTDLPLTYQQATTWRSIFQNYGYPKPKDIPILNRKIFKGTRVTIREHPYIVSVRRLYSHYVTGSLISGNIVLTVAHPVHNVCTAELGVVAAENYSDRGTSINPVIFVVHHKDFDPYVLAHDIAILRTFDEFFHSTNLKAIKLHTSELPLGAQAFVTGWGRCDFTGKELCLPRSNMYYPQEVLDPMLRTVSFTITNNSYCQDYARNEVPLRPGMMCVGTSRREQYMGACLGVPGAPLVVHGRLVGILSWGVGCGYSFDLPLVYVNVSYYRDWVCHNAEILTNLQKQELSPFNLATKAYVMQQWMNRTKILLRDAGNEHDLQTLDVDLDLADINGTLYDIRDFLYNGKYHEQKIKLYTKIRPYFRKRLAFVNYSYTMMPFLSKKKFHKLGIHIRDDGTLSEDEMMS